MLYISFGSEKKLIEDYPNIGATIGSDMKDIYNLYQKYENIYLWLPESFEYLLLCYNMFKNNKYVQDILTNPIKHIDAKDVSWERFFTHLLEEVTHGLYCEYVKNNDTEYDEEYKFKYLNKFRKYPSKCGFYINTCYIENCCHKGDNNCPMLISEDKIDSILGDKASIFKTGITNKLPSKKSELKTFHLKSSRF